MWWTSQASSACFLSANITWVCSAGLNVYQTRKVMSSNMSPSSLSYFSFSHSLQQHPPPNPQAKTFVFGCIHLASSRPKCIEERQDACSTFGQKRALHINKIPCLSLCLQDFLSVEIRGCRGAASHVRMSFLSCLIVKHIVSFKCYLKFINTAVVQRRRTSHILWRPEQLAQEFLLLQTNFQQIWPVILCSHISLCVSNLPLGTCPVEARWLQVEKRTMSKDANIAVKELIRPLDRVCVCDQKNGRSVKFLLANMYPRLAFWLHWLQHEVSEDCKHTENVMKCC